MRQQGWDTSYDARNDYGVILHDGVLMAEFQFQHGTVAEKGINGIQNEQVLQLLKDRLIALDNRVPCEENVLAIQFVQSALDVLNTRRRKREEQGLIGANTPHN